MSVPSRIQSRSATPVQTAVVQPRTATSVRRPRPAHARRLNLEPLEERLALSGFGLEDGAYILESWSGAYHEVQIQPGDQKILAAGVTYSTVPNDVRRMAIACYDSLGVPDTAYNAGGVAAPALGSGDEYGRGLVLQPDGKAIVAGQGGLGFAVARFTANGALDTGFGSGGWNSIDVIPTRSVELASAVGLRSTGKVVVAGYSYDPVLAGNDPAVLARYTANGAVDSGKNAFGDVVKGKATGYTTATFGGTFSRFEDLVIQPDDKILVVGNSNGINGLFVARYTANGVLDTTFNGSGYTALLPPGLTSTFGSSITRQSDGKIVIAGWCTGIDGAADMLVARFNTNGTLDTSFGAGSGYVRLDVDGVASQTSENGHELVIQSDGKIVVVGDYYGANPSDVLVVRLNTNGTPDSGFGSGGFKIGSLPPEMGSQSLTGRGVALLADGSIIVSGYGDWGGGLQNVHPLLIRFSGATVSPLQAAGAASSSSGAAPLSLEPAQLSQTEAAGSGPTTFTGSTAVESTTVAASPTNAASSPDAASVDRFFTAAAASDSTVDRSRPRHGASVASQDWLLDLLTPLPQAK